MANFEFIGQVIVVGAVQSGISQRSGNQWQKLDFVVQEVNTQYPRKVSFSMLGSEKIQSNPVIQGSMVKVSFDIDSHEYNGRWFNSINAWKVENAATTQAVPQQVPVDTYAPQGMSVPQSTGVPQGMGIPQQNAQTDDGTMPF